jgi:hypothetical protein
VIDVDSLILGGGAHVELEIDGILRGDEYSAIDAAIAASMARSRSRSRRLRRSRLRPAVSAQRRHHGRLLQRHGLRTRREPVRLWGIETVAT